MANNPIETISRQLMIYCGVIMCIIGGMGNILNIYVFAVWSFSRRSIQGRGQYAKSNSPLYLLVSSIANLILLLYSLSTRILFDGYQYQVKMDEVIVLCKLRYFALHTADFISLTCLCMATIDRYLVSSREVRLRRLSASRKGTMFIIVILIVLISLHGIPIALFYTTSPAGQCIVDSVSYLPYYRYMFQIFLHGLIPILVFSLFGILTYRQLKKIQSRETRQKRNNIDKQLSRMLLLTSITIVVSAIPYSAENIYYLLFATRSEHQTSYVFFFHTLSSILFYVNAVFSFYIFFVSTPNFRKQLRKLFHCQREIFPMTTTNQVNTITVSYDRD